MQVSHFLKHETGRDGQSSLSRSVRTLEATVSVPPRLRTANQLKNEIFSQILLLPGGPLELLRFCTSPRLQFFTNLSIFYNIIKF
jgi:hypothetical protein